MGIVSFEKDNGDIDYKFLGKDGGLA